MVSGCRGCRGLLQYLCLLALPLLCLAGTFLETLDVDSSPDAAAIGRARAGLLEIQQNTLLTRLILVVGRHDDDVSAVAYSPNSMWAASGDLGFNSNGSVKMWNVASADPSQLGLACILGYHQGSVNALDFSPDGSLLVSGGGDFTVRLWSVAGLPPSSPSSCPSAGGWGPRGFVGKHSARVLAVKFSSDGMKIASSGDDMNVLVWGLLSSETLQYQLLANFTGHSQRVAALAFSPDSRLIVSASFDWSLRVWNVTGNISKWGFVRKLDFHTANVRTVAWSHQGDRLVSGGDDRNVVVWPIAPLSNPESWGNFTVIGQHDVSVWSATFSADGNFVVSSGSVSRIKLWSVLGDDLRYWGFVCDIGNHDHIARSAAISPDGTRVISGGGDREVKMWYLGLSDESRWSQVRSFYQAGSVNSVAWSKLGGVFVSGSSDGHVKLYNVSTVDPDYWGLVGNISYHPGGVGAVAISADGTTVVSGGWDCQLKLVKLNLDNLTDSVLETVLNASGPVTSVAFGESLVVSGTARGHVDLWLVWQNGTKVALGMHNGSVTAVDISPGGTMAMSTGTFEVSLWNISQFFDSSEVSGDFKIKDLITGNYAESAVFSPDGLYVAAASADNSINLYNINGDISTWGKLYQIGQHSSTVKGIAFLTNGTQVVSCARDYQVKLWATGKDQIGDTGLLRRLGQHYDFVLALSASPDGRYVVSGSQGGVLRVWSVTGLLCDFEEAPNHTSSNEDGTCIEWNRWWDENVLRDYAAVLGHFPNESSISRIIPCDLQSNYMGGRRYPSCSVSVDTAFFQLSDDTTRSADLMRDFLPPFRITFATPLAGLTVKELPLPLRLTGLWLNGTNISGSAQDFFATIGGLQYIEILDISSTMVGGSLGIHVPPNLVELRAKDTLVTDVDMKVWLNVQLLDLRDTVFLQGLDLDIAGGSHIGLVWKGGTPTCETAPRGYQNNGLFCAICTEGWFWQRVGQYGECQECGPLRQLQDSNMLVLLLSLALAMGIVIYFSGIPREYLQAMKVRYRSIYWRYGYVSEKLLFTVYAYQQIAQLERLAQPLPAVPAQIVGWSRIFSFSWLSSNAFSACLFGGSYYMAWFLMILQNAVLFVVFVALAKAAGGSSFQAVIVVYGLTTTTVASTTFPLYECDVRLLHEKLNLASAFQFKPLKVDYNIDCKANSHLYFQIFATLVFLLYCGGPPMWFLRRFWQRRLWINPPLPGLDCSVEYSRTLFAKLSRPKHLPQVESEDAETVPLDYCRAVQLEMDNHLSHMQGTMKERLGRDWMVPGRGHTEAWALVLRARLVEARPEIRLYVEMVSPLVPSKWWWLLVPILGRVLVALVMVFPPVWQSPLGVFASSIVGIGVLRFLPYKRLSDNHHLANCQFSIAAAFALLSVSQADQASVSSSSLILNIVSGIVLSIPALSFFTYVSLRFLGSASRNQVLWHEEAVDKLGQHEIELSEMATYNSQPLITSIQ